MNNINSPDNTTSLGENRYCELGVAYSVVNKRLVVIVSGPSVQTAYGHYARCPL